jgi:hypothetical protein
LDTKQILDVVNGAGVVGLFVIFFVGLMRKWWVMGWTYNEAIEREREWRELALTGTKLAEHFAARKAR